MQKMSSRVSLIAAIALAVSLSACGGPSSSSSDAPGAKTLRLAINNTAASLPAVVAEEKGFFEENGIEAELSTVADITKLPPTLGKQYDIGFGVQPTLIRAVSQGVPIVMISGNAETTNEKPEYVLMTRPDTGIESAADFAGRKLGAPTLNGNIHIGTLYWLEENGVALEDVTSLQVPTPTMVDQLKAGLIDVAEIQQPYIDVAKKAGMVEAGYSLAAVGDPAAMSSWQAERGWTKDNPEIISAFRASLEQAIDWIENNDSEARDLIAKHTGIDRAVIGESPLPAFTIAMSVESVEQWDAPMRAVAGFSSDMDYSSLIAGP